MAWTHGTGSAIGVLLFALILTLMPFWRCAWQTFRLAMSFSILCVITSSEAEAKMAQFCTL